MSGGTSVSNGLTVTGDTTTDNLIVSGDSSLTTLTASGATNLQSTSVQGATTSMVPPHLGEHRWQSSSQATTPLTTHRSGDQRQGDTFNTHRFGPPISRAR